MALCDDRNVVLPLPSLPARIPGEQRVPRVRGRARERCCCCYLVNLEEFGGIWWKTCDLGFTWLMMMIRRNFSDPGRPGFRTAPIQHKQKNSKLLD